MPLYHRPMAPDRDPAHARPIHARTAPILLVLMGLGLLALCFRLDDAWLNAHVLQLNLWPAPTADHAHQIRKALIGVVLVMAIALFAAAGAIRWGLARRNRSADLLGIVLAILSALGTGELYLLWRERTHPRSKMTHELFGSPHPRYGWIWTPSLTAVERVAGRDVRLSFNRQSIRVRSAEEELDPKAPSLLFAGESVAAGQGLQYEETFAALASAALGTQAVNLAVNGYGSDQAYLRLTDELPRFERVVGTVTTFLPVQLGRNLQDLKPRLVLNARGALEWTPAATGFFTRLRLRRLLVNELPYTSERRTAATVALTRAILRDTVRRTEERGGKAVFLIPSQGPPRSLEQHPEAWLIRSVFEAEGLPYLLVDLDGDMILNGDPHPSPQGARLIASVLLQALGKKSAPH